MKRMSWAVGLVLVSMALLAAGFEMGVKSVGPIERLEVSGMVIDGGPIRAAAKWRM